MALACEFEFDLNEVPSRTDSHSLRLGVRSQRCMLFRCLCFEEMMEDQGEMYCNALEIIKLDLYNSEFHLGQG